MSSSKTKLKRPKLNVNNKPQTLDLSNVNSELKCEIFDTQVQIDVLQQKLRQLMEIANQQLGSKKEPVKKE